MSNIKTLKGVPADRYDEVVDASERSGGGWGYVRWDCFPGTSDEIRSERYFEAVWDGLVDDPDETGQGELVEHYECQQCRRVFGAGDTFVNGDGQEWCHSDTGNGCVEQHIGQPYCDWQ